MSKRRINQQQTRRIEKKQAEVRDETHSEGLVIRRFGSHAIIESTEKNQIYCSIRPSIDSLVAGDKIIWQSEGKDQGVIISRYPRQSVLGRPDKQGQIRPVAANLDQIMIVIAAKPEVSWPLLDSYLIVAEYLDLEACIVLNKADLPCEDVKKRLVEQYESLAYPFILTRHDDKKSEKNLQKRLQDRTSVFVGQSGVGKSSLISRLLPHIEGIQTGSISLRHDLGKHTTSHSSFYHLPSGGALIDSPGVREFGLWHMPLADIAQGYREFQPYLSQCKFRNCRHYDTPSCALFAAVEKGLLSQDRYHNFVNLARDIATK